MISFALTIANGDILRARASPRAPVHHDLRPRERRLSGGRSILEIRSPGSAAEAGSVPCPGRRPHAGGSRPQAAQRKLSTRRAARLRGARPERSRAMRPTANALRNGHDGSTARSKRRTRQRDADSRGDLGDPPRSRHRSRDVAGQPARGSRKALGSTPRRARVSAKLEAGTLSQPTNRVNHRTRSDAAACAGSSPGSRRSPPGYARRSRSPGDRDRRSRRAPRRWSPRGRRREARS